MCHPKRTKPIFECRPAFARCAVRAPWRVAFQERQLQEKLQPVLVAKLYQIGRSRMRARIRLARLSPTGRPWLPTTAHERGSSLGYLPHVALPQKTCRAI
jgi:hypothetical protein